MIQKAFIFITLSFFLKFAHAQDDLMDMLEETEEQTTQYTIATFKSTRVATGHSIERMPQRQLDFRVAHRFGRVNSGAYEFFGLDQSNIHLSLEYGITDWLMVGIGRSSFQKVVDGFYKLSILRQSTGKKVMPVSVSLFSGIYANGLKQSVPNYDYYFSNRLSFVHQVLIGHKFNELISLQLSPTYIHRNFVETPFDSNDIYALGIGGRVKLTSRVTLNAEYYYRLNPQSEFATVQASNPLSIGFDIETGGHVFQLHFTNSRSMIEPGFIGETTGEWLKGDIHFGFNISRVFNL